MAIHFSLERMEQALAVYGKWWDGTLDRPLAAVTIRGAYGGERKARAPFLDQSSCADFRWSPEEVIEALDERLSECEYLGDAYPRVNFDAFGPGALAAFCGAKLDNSSGRVWFFPREQKEIADIRVRYDPENPWSRRIKAIYRAGLSRWGGVVAMGMPDLGGVMDVAATFRGSENLLMDLYDDPDEVLRLIGEIETAWREAYRDFESVLRTGNPGYTDWTGLLSPVPSYVLQCDLSYMIGNGMFRRFVLPTLERDADWLGNSIYHLDGIGELNHLDTLLSIEKLNAVQWVYGDGQPGPMRWLPVYRKIQSAGKRIMLSGTPSELLETIGELGGKGMYLNVGLSPQESDMAKALLEAR